MCIRVRWWGLPLTCSKEAVKMNKEICNSVMLCLETKNKFNSAFLDPGFGFSFGVYLFEFERLK